MATAAANPATPPPVARVGLNAGARVFLDTNILVYASDPSSPFHADAVAATTWLVQNGIDSWISRQILREYIASMTRPKPAGPAVPLANVITNTRRLEHALAIVEDGPAVTAELLALLTAIPCQGKQVHDANIVATMMTHALSFILTHNTADFARFSHHIRIIPLV